MIDIELLRGIRKVIAHGREEGPCADGLAAAMIVRDVLPEVIVDFVRYESPELREIPVEPGLLFLDIAPPTERVEEFLSAGTLVLDHHATVADVVRRFLAVGQGVYGSSPGMSAAPLAYHEVWAPLVRYYEGANGYEARQREGEISHFAKLAGIYDTWQKSDPLWSQACEQVAVLYSFPQVDWLGREARVFGEEGSLERRMELGAQIVAQNRRRAEALVVGAYRFESKKGTRVAVLASSMISDAADLVEDADVVIGFEFRVRRGSVEAAIPKPSIKLSLRSRKGSVNVRSIAEALGGGGHDTAASVWMELAPYHPEPYALVRLIYAQWEDAL